MSKTTKTKKKAPAPSKLGAFIAPKNGAAPKPAAPPPAAGETKNLHVRVDFETWRRLRTYSLAHGRTVQDILADQIDALIKNTP